MLLSISLSVHALPLCHPSILPVQYTSGAIPSQPKPDYLIWLFFCTVRVPGLWIDGLLCSSITSRTRLPITTPPSPHSRPSLAVCPIMFSSGGSSHTAAIAIDRPDDYIHKSSYISRRHMVHTVPVQIQHEHYCSSTRPTPTYADISPPQISCRGLPFSFVPVR